MALKILFDRIDEPGLNTLEVYRRRGGYDALEQALKMEPDEVLAQISDSGIRGRGGAGFRMGQKAGFLPHGDMEKYLVCNADESEPGTFKDRELMQKSPHMLIEGIIIASYAVDIHRAFIYIRGEYAHQADILEAAIAEAVDAGLIGERILGSGHSLTLVLHRGAGAYICGEETGLLDSLEGKRGNPRLKPPFPAIEGLYHGPTLINNVETLATVPAIIRMTGKEYAEVGTETSTGTKLVSVSGDVRRPGNYEIELGIPSRELIYDLAGGPERGPRDQVLVPRRLEFTGPDQGRPRRPVRLRLDGKGGIDARVRRGDRRRRHATPCSRSRSSSRSSTRTSRAGSACRAARAPTGRSRCSSGSSPARRRRWTSTSWRRCRSRSSATACASWATRWRCRSAR